MPGIDAEVVRHALQVAREHGFYEVTIEQGGTSFSAVLDRIKPARKTELVVAELASQEEPAVAVKAPLVGYYRERSPALAVGSSVQQGDVIGIVAALGLDNDVESPVAGEVVELLVQDGEPVEYGQPLALLKVGA